MTSSSFINALRRVVALRGEIKELRSDRGTNFIGAADSIKAEVINVEDKVVKTYLSRSEITWKLNAPHSSHMGGVWERMIWVSRRILDSMLAECKGKEMTHEVLTTFMAEVCTIINSRPITTISYDPDMPMVLTPSLLLTQKVPGHPAMSEGFDTKDNYKAQWRHVQVLVDTFWKQWKEHFLNTLQVRRKWMKDHQNLKVGDVVLLKDNILASFEWPTGVVQRVFPSDHDGRVRKVEVRIIKDGKTALFTRPVTEVVLLID